MKIKTTLAALLCSVALASAQSLFTANLDAAQDGGGARSGSGLVNLILTGTTLTLNGSFSGLSGNVTLSHIHGPAPVGSVAGILYNLGGSVVPLGGTSGTISGSVNLAPSATYTLDQQLNQLNSGLWYINIHSSTFGGGEIRGQIVPVPEPSTWAMLGIGAFGTIWALRRRKA